MNFDLSTLLLFGCGYLLLLFGTAWLTERKWLPERLIHHPIVHVLALGVFASAWTFYGIFGVAYQSGYLYLVSYLGSSAAFMLAPLLMVPILRITRRHQLSSLADLFAFRFRSGHVGTLTTLLMLFISLPLISIQIQALADSLPMLNPRISSNQAAVGFCLMIALFTILFGARHASLRNSHNGLVLAIATESLVKLVALLAIAGYALFAVLDGPSGLLQWLDANPQELQRLQQPPGGHWQTLLLVFFASTIVMPHMFHIAFTENLPTESLYRATWGLPLFLLLLALAVPPILWAAIKHDAVDNPEYLILQLGQTLQLPWLSLLAFIGGLSAASGIIIVATVALASMLQNHVVLPLVRIPGNVRFYAWLLWIRRLIILAVMLGSYLFFHFIGHRFALNQLGLLAFVAFLQFLPGVLVTLYWPGASRNGFLAGIGTGFSIWTLGLLLPMMGIVDSLPDADQQIAQGYKVALISLLANCLALIAVSILFPGRREERRAADACLLNALPRPSDQGLQVQSDADFVSRLQPRLGEKPALREVRRALRELQLPAGRLSPLDSLRLRTQLEQNLSGLLGPVEAAALLQPLDLPAGTDGFKGRNVHLLEQQLEAYDQRLSGLAAELNQLRRYHRATLQRLPIGVCTLDGEQRILFWNAELENYTGLNADQALGNTLAQLPTPWSQLLLTFTNNNALHQEAQMIELQGQQRWFSLHKARLDDTPAQGKVLLIEEETQHQLMARKLAHSERLASIGRFAAGVAHEIGNPVTGIACLAQNLKLETEQPEVLETGDQIVDQTRRINRIVQSLIRFAHTGRQEGPGHLEPVNLHDCIEEAIHLVTLDRHSRQQQFTNAVDTELRIQGDLQLLLQVFVNLLNNASDASPAASEIRIESDSSEHSSRILITDEGSGIPEEHLDQLFEPFFTTKEPGKGTGLGLPLVYNIITQHYGNIEIVSPANKKQNKGTRVIITLPRLQHSVSPEQPEADGEGLSG